MPLEKFVRLLIVNIGFIYSCDFDEKKFLLLFKYAYKINLNLNCVFIYSH